MGGGWLSWGSRVFVGGFDAEGVDFMTSRAFEVLFAAEGWDLTLESSRVLAM